MQFSPTSLHFIAVRSRYSPQHPVLKHPQSTLTPITHKLNVSGQLWTFSLFWYVEPCPQCVRTFQLRPLYGNNVIFGCSVSLLQFVSTYCSTISAKLLRVSKPLRLDI
jgi:hypothetical protein